MTGVDFKIRASQRLLLKAAFSQNKQEGAAALSQWWGRVGDFHEVQGTDASIFPEIYGNLGAYISDPKLAARMRGVARHHWLKNKYLIRFCAELLNHLADAGIPVLLLKGVAIATAIDRDPGLRAMNDCDVLVPRSLAIRAVRILESTGLIEKAFVDARDLDIIHGVTLFHSGTGLGHLDVHWRPLRPIGSEEFGKEMFDAARPVSFDDRECLAPCPEHLLFQSIVHGVEWSPAPNYGWLVDVTKILRRVGTDFDWERLIDVARRYHYLFLIRSALREARTHCGVTIPRWADRRLSAWFAPLERREIRASLSRPTTRSTADELLLGLQKTRRGAVENLGRPPWRAGAQLLGRLLGPSFAGGVAGSIGMDPDQVTLLYGWSAPEPTGRWTEGRLASFAIRASEPQPATALKLRGFPLGSKGVRPHVVEVFAGFRRLGAIVWPPFGTFPYAQTIPLPSRIWKNGVAVLRLDMPTRMSPVEMGISYDARALGIFVEEISLNPPARDLTERSLDLTSEGADRGAMWHGWSFPEPHGCWTFGPISCLRWRALAPIKACSMLLVEVVMLAPGLEELRGRFRLNELLLGSFCYAPARRFETLLQFPIREPIVAGRDVDLRIEVDNPRSPAETTGSEDQRPLGLAVRRVWMDRATAARG